MLRRIREIANFIKYAARRVLFSRQDVNSATRRR